MIQQIWAILGVRWRRKWELGLSNADVQQQVNVFIGDKRAVAVDDKGVG